MHLSGTMGLEFLQGHGSPAYCCLVQNTLAKINVESGTGVIILPCKR
jgi:hypothetical protein